MPRRCQLAEENIALAKKSVKGQVGQRRKARFHSDRLTANLRQCYKCANAHNVVVPAAVGRDDRLGPGVQLGESVSKGAGESHPRSRS